MDEWGKGFVGELDYREEAPALHAKQCSRAQQSAAALPSFWDLPSEARNAKQFQEDIAKTPLAGAACLAGLTRTECVQK